MIFGLIRFLRNTRAALQQLGAEPFAELYDDCADEWEPYLWHSETPRADTTAA
jgi:hypothetical protein